MPFRTKETLESWIAEFAGADAAAVSIDVLRHHGDPGEDTGLVVVRLRNATTEVHLEPVAPSSPAWHVIFGPRDTYFSLGVEGLKSLSFELSRAAELCGFLELKSLEALAEIARARAEVRPEALPAV